ncbi:hypothetical protein E1264_38105 [Actinomadura sp. KC216]|uniref:hypothetical protein n=1 Tax=Actinomadura sp. KC216 TaxID=2530370 RepID=UPI00104E3DBA|nr:hypothetical protein [Actinomadura sp. KC216]TDB76803.1 hypothetical protein E1264_38105 [Actinomadura sp. KC216]
MSDRIYLGAPHDELAARIRALEAERLRPVPPPPRQGPRINLTDLAELCDALGDEENDSVEGA